MIENLASMLECAVRAAQRPSQVILSGFRNAGVGVDRKNDGSVVTEIDREAERIIREFLASCGEPAWPVLGEEFGDSSGGAEYRWVVDPIDGTLGYTRGLPTFGTLLAFEDVRNARSLVGVIHLPASAETYSAARGGGAWCNGQAIHVAPSRALRDCLISLPGAHHLESAGMQEGYAHLYGIGPHLRGNADCWSHAMVARGAIDVLVELGLSRWDIAATEVLIEEAGGECLLRPSRTHAGKWDIVIGNPQAVREVARILSF